MATTLLSQYQWSIGAHVQEGQKQTGCGGVRIQGQESLSGFLGPVFSLFFNSAFILALGLVRQSVLLLIKSLSLTWTRSNWFPLGTLKGISIYVIVSVYVYLVGP